MKYRIPMMLTITIPEPTHTAYAKLRSKVFRAKIKMVNAVPQKTKVKTEEQGSRSHQIASCRWYRRPPE